MKVISTILMIVGVIGIIIIAALLMGFILYSLDPPIINELTPATVSPEALKSFDQKISSFKQKVETAAAAKEKKEVILTLTSEEVNSKMTELLAQGDLPLKEQATINFDNDLCKIYAPFNKTAMNAKIGLIAQLLVSKGNLKIVVADFQLGKLPLPKSMVERVGNILDIIFRMEGMIEDLNIDITGVTLSEDRLTIKGTTRLIN
jgi:hypothetical protein